MALTAVTSGPGEQALHDCAAALPGWLHRRLFGMPVAQWLQAWPAECGAWLDMGNVYRSEYWTYPLPRRVGLARALALAAEPGVRGCVAAPAGRGSGPKHRFSWPKTAGARLVTLSRSLPTRPTCAHATPPGTS